MADWVDRAADALANALWAHQQLPGLPEEYRPLTQTQAYAIQKAFAERIGPVGAWKVGSTGPHEARTYYAPIPNRLIAESPAEAPLETFFTPAIEVEVAFRIGEALPAGSKQYSSEDVISTVASAHTAIEVIDSRYLAGESIDEYSRLADLQNNAFFVIGDGIPDWSATSIPELLACLKIDDRIVVESRGGNPADPCRLLVSLANTFAQQGHPLAAGDLVTCGSHTGKYPVSEPLRATARFETLGTAELRIT